MTKRGFYAQNQPVFTIGGVSLKRFINDVKKYWNYTRYAAKSQLKTEVANSYLNWLWWILEPFCFMLIYAFVFGMLVRNKIISMK